MRIWNRENRLIRQIQFEEEISGICLANAKGDVLIGIGSRIDMVKASVYLPHNYQEKLAKIRITKPDIEKSLKFDDNLVSVQKPKGIDNLQRTSAYFDKTNAFEIFSQANLLWHIIPESEKYNISKRSSIKYSMRNSSLRGGADEDSVYFQNINLDIFLQKYDLGRVREKSIISISKSPTFESLKLSPSIDHLPHTRKVSNTNESSDKSYLPDLLPVESSSLEYEIKPKTRRYIPQDGFQPNTLGHIVPILPVNLPQNLIKIKLEPSIPKPKIAYKSLLLKFNDLNNQTSQSLTVIPPVSNVTINTVTPSGVTISTVTPSNITTNPVPPSGIPINPIPPIPTPIPTNPKSQSTPPTLLPLLYEPLLNYKWTPTNLLFHSYSTCITRDGKLSRTPLNLSGDGIVPILTGIYPSLDLSSKVEMVNYLTSHFPPHSLSKLFEIFEQDMISWIKIDDMDLILEYGVEIRDERLLHKLGIKFEKPNLDDILRGVREMKGKKVGKVLDLLRGRKRVVKRGGRGSFEDCIDGLNYLYYVECEKKSSELMRNVKKVEDGEKRARGLNLKSEQTVHLAQNHELVPRVLSPAPRVLDSKSEKTALLVENHKLEVVLRPRKEVKQAISRITQRRKPLVKPVRPFLGKPAVKITLNSMPMGRASCQLSSLVGQSECQVSSVILTNQEFSTFDNGKDSFKTSRKFFLPSL